MPDSTSRSPGSARHLSRRWRNYERVLHPVLTPEELLEKRVEHRPPGPCCRDCRHLGDPVSITDHRGCRRVRRACPQEGHTAPEWPACAQFEPRTNADETA